MCESGTSKSYDTKWLKPLQVSSPAIRRITYLGDSLNVIVQNLPFPLGFCLATLRHSVKKLEHKVTDFGFGYALFVSVVY
ncbi:hypothetical protein ACOSP7_005722 [Xanthoceras sorbifolium]